MTKRRHEENAIEQTTTEVSHTEYARQAPPPDARAGMERLRSMWVAAQPTVNDSVGGVTLTRDQAAAVYAYVCRLEGREPA